jgi:hypothetical protein
MERHMPIPKSQLDRILDSVEKMIDSIGEQFARGEDCDYGALAEKMKLRESPKPDGSPEKIHGQGDKKSLF